METERSSGSTTLLPRAPAPTMGREMKLTIFAATGGIGRQVLEQAVAVLRVHQPNVKGGQRWP
jgi:hypothetical protein